MAKSRSNSKMRVGRRVTFANANPKKNVKIYSVALPLSNHINYLNSLLAQQRRVAGRALGSDRRRFNPGDPIYQTNHVPARIVRSFRSSIVERHISRPGLSRISIISPHVAKRYQINPSGFGKFDKVVREGWSFQDPDRTILCVRRKRRREVLHAQWNKGGGGGRKFSGKPRRNQFSDIRC